ncbi:hypothetical protein DFJ63DRAFT_319763 [Scheffersomyces coipomensis]|uniref:uncharacterized protein n=1 Tax=Scheffersomyces coipomensis TaxID=1788519 RepID=UPI00315D7E2E
MSMFRTLQNSPATITLFHNTKIPLSTALYQILDKAYIKLPSKSPNQFIIDLAKDRIPTYDQYKHIVSNCLVDSKSKKFITNCYPFLNDRTTTGVSASEIVTFKGVAAKNSVSHKLFNEGEYALIEETFNKLHEIKEDDLAAVQPADIFKAPLIIDWDQNLIAADEESLQKILSKYT